MWRTILHTLSSSATLINRGEPANVGKGPDGREKTSFCGRNEEEKRLSLKVADFLSPESRESAQLPERERCGVPGLRTVSWRARAPTAHAMVKRGG